MFLDAYFHSTAEAILVTSIFSAPGTGDPSAELTCNWFLCFSTRYAFIDGFILSVSDAGFDETPVIKRVAYISYL